jgi:hypothetical protein
MKSVYDQEQEPTDSEVVIFKGASEAAPPS